MLILTEGGLKRSTVQGAGSFLIAGQHWTQSDPQFQKLNKSSPLLHLDELIRTDLNDKEIIDSTPNVLTLVLSITSG